MSFADNVIFITGAGREPGRTIAQAFAGQGAIIAAHDLTPIHVDQTVARIEDSGGRAKAYVGDTSKKIFLQTLLDDILADWGRIDVLVNSLAVAPDNSVLAMDEWDWRYTFDINVGGPFLLTQSVGRIMREQGGGAMLTIVAGGQRVPEPGRRAAYLASQLSLIGLVREAAAGLAGDGIRVNAIGPDLADLLVQAGLGQESSLAAQWQAQIPAEARRDLTSLALFLCSDEATPLTGLVIGHES